MRLVRTLILATLSAVAFAGPASAQNYAPAFDYESLLNTYFDDESGLISFTGYTLAFAPEGPFKGAAAVVNAENTVVASFPFFEEVRVRNGVFAQVQVQGPADVTLTEPGIYNIVLLVNGQPATRLAFLLEQVSAGDDPFNPQKTYRFDGLWRKYAYFSTSTFKDRKIPILNLWLGGVDLPEGAARGGFMATLYRDGETIAHSKRTQGVISAGHFERTNSTLYLPHDEKGSPNAIPLGFDDLQADGKYEIRVTRKSDGAAIRSYDFTVTDGKIQELPQTQLGYQPAIDYILPRVVKKGISSFEMDEAIWLADEPAQ